MSVADRKTDFESFEKGDRVAVHFACVPRQATEDARRLTGEIVTFYSDEKAMIDSIPEADRDCRWIVDFGKRHSDDGVRKYNGDGIGSPVWVETDDG